jgi:hypothetical protein
VRTLTLGLRDHFSEMLELIEPSPLFDAALEMLGPRGELRPQGS